MNNKSKDILKGTIALSIITTLIWSLNLNFGIVSANWFEVFCAGTLIIMILASIFVRK